MAAVYDGLAEQEGVPAGQYHCPQPRAKSLWPHAALGSGGDALTRTLGQNLQQIRSISCCAQTAVLDLFAGHTVAVALSGYLFFGSAITVSSKVMAVAEALVSHRDSPEDSDQVDSPKPGSLAAARRAVLATAPCYVILDFRWALPFSCLTYWCRCLTAYGAQALVSHCDYPEEGDQSDSPKPGRQAAAGRAVLVTAPCYIILDFRCALQLAGRLAACLPLALPRLPPVPCCRGHTGHVNLLSKASCQLLVADRQASCAEPEECLLHAGRSTGWMPLQRAPLAR